MFTASSQRPKRCDTLLEARLFGRQSRLTGASLKSEQPSRRHGNSTMLTRQRAPRRRSSAGACRPWCARPGPDPCKSNSSTPRLVSMTSGPETLMRPCSETASGRAAAGDQTAAAIAAGAAADQTHDRDARRGALRQSRA